MGRPPRYVPKGYGDLVEVTTRTIQGRLLLRPSDDINEIFMGILGRALKVRPGVGIVAFTFMSNHYVMLLRVKDAGAMARFMEYVNGNLAREACRLHDWEDKLWSRRYRSIPVVDEASQVARLRYVLAHGAKEGLVQRPVDWPGAKSLDGLLHGKCLTGVWFDRTLEYNARRSGHKVGKYDFATRYEVPLVPLPCWEELSAEQRRRRCAALVADIEQEAAEENLREGRVPPGPEFILRQHPHDRPREMMRSPAPLCHAATKKARKAYRAVHDAVVEAFRAAAECLRVGSSEEVNFPPGCFPPGLPFVPFPLEVAALSP
jgi:hypothetical protein